MADWIDELVDWQLDAVKRNGRFGSHPRWLFEVFLDGHREWPPTPWCSMCNPNGGKAGFLAGHFPLPAADTPVADRNSEREKVQW